MGRGIPWIARAAFGSSDGGKVLRHLYARPFPKRGDRKRVLVLYENHPNFIALIYPLAALAPQFEDRFDASLRFFPVAKLSQGLPSGLSAPDTVIFQHTPQRKQESFEDLFATLQRQFNGAQFILFDGADHWMNPIYGKVAGAAIPVARRSLPVDMALYERPMRKGSFLADAYSDIVGRNDPVIPRPMAPDIAANLHLLPNYHTLPRHFTACATGAFTPFSETRKIDLHARMATAGDTWYGAMRRLATAKATALEGLEVRAEGRVTKREFMAEMRNTRLCFSPFGHGEMCWRDVEAWMAGAVLVKPDMGHIRTEGDLYVADETYAPVRWDFSDLRDVVHALLADPARCRRLVETAAARLKAVTQPDHLLKTYAFAFA